MTERQLRLLRPIADGRIHRALTSTECEALRAMMAERAELLETLVETHEWIGDWDECNGKDRALFARRADAIRRANGGP
jgi:hypothetical protein